MEGEYSLGVDIAGSTQAEVGARLEQDPNRSASIYLYMSARAEVL